MRKIVITGLASLLLAMPSAVSADEAAPPALTTADDLLCVAVAIIMGTSPDPALQDSSKALTLYYVGRIEGSGTNVDLKTEIPESIKQVQGNKYVVIAKECGKPLAHVAEELGVIAKILDQPQKSAPIAQPPKRSRNP